MATGDITGVEISPSGAEPFGACADITIEGFTTGKTVDFGSGIGNALAYADIASATIVFTVVSEGYNSSGTLGTITRTVYATKIVRKPYPNQTSNEEPAATSIRVALSDFVYDDDNTGAGKSGTAPTVTIAAGCIVNAGGSSEENAAATALACTNSSTLDYPKVLGRWDRTAGVWQADRVSAAFNMAARCYHRFGIACVIFDADGQASANNETETVTARQVTQRSASSLYAEAYKTAAISLSGFTENELVDLRFRAYPTVGDADSVLDTNNNTTALHEVRGRNKHTITIDGDSSLDAIAYVATDGNDTTGDGTEGAPWATIGKAVSQSKNIIYLKAGTHAAVGLGHTRVANTHWYIIQPAPGLGVGDVTVQADATTKAYDCARLQYKGVTFQLVSTSSWLDGENQGNYLRFTNVTFIRNGIGAPTTGLGYRSNGVVMEGCTGLGENTWDLNIWNNSACAYCFDGCTFTGAATPATGVSSGIWETVACDLDGCDRQWAEPASGVSTNGTHDDVLIFEFNQWRSMDGASTLIAYGELSNISSGIGIIGNVIECIDAAEPKGLGISSDGSTTTVNNVLLFHNTIAGVRCNIGYNSVGSTSYAQRNYCEKFNAWRQWNNKDDTFPTEDAARTGSWPVGYAVGYLHNHVEDELFVGEYSGLGYTTGASGFINDQSITGGGAGQGDYTPDTGSVLLARIPTGERVVLWDLYGTPVAANGDVGAIQVTPSGSILPILMQMAG